MMTLAQAHAMLPDSVLVGDGSVQIDRVHSDTRTLLPGDLFVALKGASFDAHAFLAQARGNGAVAALAEHGLEQAGLSGLHVPDSLVALGQLAAAWRRRFQIPLIAVTGSNGKTTVTQMISFILHAWLNDGAFATAGNFNNQIGLPLTLLRLRQDDTTWHRAGVVELGMNQPGEIGLLSLIASPTVALVNNAQREHQEFMHSVDAVARENGSVFEALGPAGVAVFPADDAHAALWYTLAGKRPTLTFALDGQADVTCIPVWDDKRWAVMLQTPAGSTALQLNVAGLHNVKNALAAVACGLAAGCPLGAIQRGLEAFVPVKGRSDLSTWVRHGKFVTLVDDTYNANPDSVRAAIDVLAGLAAPRWLVLGDMGEVGDQGPEFHREVGAYAAQRGIEKLWVVGSLSLHTAAAFPGARHFANVADMIRAVNDAPECRAVVVKGSRFMKMEQFVSALVASGGKPRAA
jgi:UDP-N-acetylmuramoyl-tripeptide--D-alanyl-D-alanine ligase